MNTLARARRAAIAAAQDARQTYRGGLVTPTAGIAGGGAVRR